MYNILDHNVGTLGGHVEVGFKKMHRCKVSKRAGYGVIPWAERSNVLHLARVGVVHPEFHIPFEIFGVSLDCESVIDSSGVIQHSGQKVHH